MLESRHFWFCFCLSAICSCIARSRSRSRPLHCSIDGLAAAILRDYFFGCATRRVVTAVRNNWQKAYLYHFTCAS